MRLRDYFAAAAMQGQLASVSTTVARETYYAAAGDEPMPNYVAKLSYKMADAMLAARIARTQPGEEGQD